MVCALVHQLFLCSREGLVGSHDRTAVIARSPCCVEEAIFGEIVNGGEAQLALLTGTC